jgi:N-acetylglucosamine-6-sulfatase
VPPGWHHWRAVGSAAERSESRGLYSADYLATAATRFVDATPTGTPFFLYLGYSQPHLPAVPPDRYAAAPVTLAPWPPSFNEADVSDKPPAIRRLPLADAATISRWRSERTSKARSLMAVDDSVRTLTTHLQRRGLLDRTVLVVLSDNGYGFGSHRIESKAFPYEELVTVPFHVRFPGRAATTVQHQVSLLDVAPTVAAIGGTTVPQARGLSLLGVLRDPGAPPPPRTWVFLEGPRRDNPWQAVRSTRYKYVVYESGARELYDLAADPYELRNRVGDPAYALQVAQAAAALDALRP